MSDLRFCRDCKKEIDINLFGKGKVPVCKFHHNEKMKRYKRATDPTIRHFKWSYRPKYKLNFSDNVNIKDKKLIEKAFKKTKSKNIKHFSEIIGFHRGTIDKIIKGAVIGKELRQVLELAILRK